MLKSDMSKLSKQKGKGRKRIKVVNVEPSKEMKTVMCLECGSVQSERDFCRLCGQDLR